MDELTKILLVILGFFFGVSGQIVVQLNSERRKKAAVRDIIRVEIQAYIEACETKDARKRWTTPAMRILTLCGMHKSTIIAFLLFVAFFSAVNATAKTASEIFEKASPSVVVVHIYDEKGKVIGLGSGVVLPGGDVATNCHVIKKATGIKVYQSGKGYHAVLRYNDRDRDVCSLSVQGMKAPPVTMGATKTIKIGSRVYAIGTPKGLELTLSDGIVSSLRRVEGGHYLQITAPISPGSSGGGLFDEEGFLIGLTTFYIAEGQQLNFAVPAEWIGELPTRHKKDVKTAETYVDWLNKALALEKKKDWTGLISHVGQWTKVSPQNPLAWYIIGIAYDHTFQTTKAIEAYQRVLLINPEYAEAWNNLGNAYISGGQTTKAIEAYQKALRITPEDAEVWSNLGVAYDESGQSAKAIEACLQALRITPEYSKAWYGLGSAYHSSGQITNAIEAYQRALRIDPAHTLAWYNLGIAFNKSGQRGQVTEVYKRLKALDPRMAELFFNKVVLP